jgi:hypothetical protein
MKQRKNEKSKERRLLDYLYIASIALSLGMCAVDAVTQSQNDRYIKSLAEEIVRKANADNPLSRVIALRDYLRERVTFREAEDEGRPFLRASAAETLRSGHGYCGEVTRAFIKLAEAVGIKAQRINLYGSDNHVVAEAEIKPGESVLVDAQNPPHLQELESLDKVMLRPEYDDYSTLHLRRLHLNWLISRVKLQMGMLTYWVESPYALKSVLWLALALTLLIGRYFLIAARSLSRKLLVRRGWVKVIDNGALEARTNEIG